MIRETAFPSENCRSRARWDAAAHRRRFRAAAVLVAAAAVLCSTGCISAGEPLAVAPQVAVERYTGRWYEIARYPNWFERGCANVTADYALRDDGTLSVINTCRSQDGQTVTDRIEGFARIADPETNAKLTVYFFWPFGAPYWILEIGAEYEYAVVGEPSRSFLWILSRTPTLDDATLAGILNRLPDLGYDPARLEWTPQTGAPLP